MRAQDTVDLESNPGRVLIVEDSRVNADLLCAVLSNAFQTKVIDEGTEAVDAAVKMAADIVLVDVDLPGVDGFEVTRRLAEDPRTRDIPVIFVTAYSNPEQEVRGLEAGAVDYIVKPISPMVTFLRVRTHIVLKRVRDRLVDWSTRDGLTGVYNRRHFDTVLDSEFWRGQREGIELCLINADVDHFKAYNDYYGHPAGDDCLRAVVSALRGGIHRPSDDVFRTGGEEFAILLPHTNLAGALHVAEVMRKSIEALALPHAASALGYVTISLGVAHWGSGEVGSPADFFSRGDEALYRAKQAGRNRVCN